MDELYQRAIIQAADRNVTRRLERPSGNATSYSTFCGDQVSVDVHIENSKIAAIGQEVQGCILCRAATAIMSECAMDQTVAGMNAVTEQLIRMLMDKAVAPKGQWSNLSIFLPVRDHKSRHDCVLLPFKALNDAITMSINSSGEGKGTPL